MGDINYFDIIANVPSNDDEIAGYFERKMKMAERDLFYKPEDFINGLKGVIKNDAAKKRSYLENEIDAAVDYGHKMSYNLRTDVLDNETYDEYHTRRVEVEIESYKSQLEEVSRDESKLLAGIDRLQGGIDDLRKGKLKPLTRVLREDEQRFLYVKLKDEGFIGSDEDYQNFCFAFGGAPLMGEKFKKIKWCVKNKQCLRDLLSKIKYGGTDAEMRRTAELYFLDMKGQKMNLPQNRKRNEQSADENSMNEILKQFEKI
ncbi:MAG: hypothetical protein PHT18_05965 [Proteiniphilum sp.]|nr:hypothetical protein [Proteiniphilum sp.]